MHAQKAEYIFDLLQKMKLMDTQKDIVDFKGTTKLAGKKTKKDVKKGKATIISLLGYKNAVIYSNKLKQNIYNKLRSHNNKANELRETINFIMERDK